MQLQGRDLKLNMSGEDVQLLHNELQALSFTIAAIEIERKFFGQATRLAVLEFQRNHELEPTGVVDERTAKKGYLKEK